MIKYRSGYKYQLAEDYTFLLHSAFPEVDYVSKFIGVHGRKCTLKEGYASDGPSGPTIDTKTFMRGAFEHDGTYQLIRLGVFAQRLRKFADIKLKTTLKEDGMAWPRRQWVYYGLKHFGRKAALKSSIKPILTAGFKQQ